MEVKKTYYVLFLETPQRRHEVLISTKRTALQLYQDFCVIAQNNNKKNDITYTVWLDRFNNGVFKGVSRHAFYPSKSMYFTGKEGVLL